jgi:hypothetical protein
MNSFAVDRSISAEKGASWEQKTMEARLVLKLLRIQSTAMHDEVPGRCCNMAAANSFLRNRLTVRAVAFLNAYPIV